MIVRLAFTFSALAIALPGDLQADNWPCWRGPNYDGLSPEENIPVRWSHSENVHWRIAIDGVGHSSPIVWENSIFLTSCNETNQSRHLCRVDRETGQIVWNRQLAHSPIEQMHRDNSAASATPVTDGKNVYVVFVVDDSLEVQAVDFDGHVVWSKRIGSFSASHGFCTSLVLAADSIYLSGLQDGNDAFVARLQKDTGEVEWKVPRSKAIRSYSTPYLCNVRGTPAVLLSGAEQTIAYDRASGKTIWAIDGPGSKTVSSIVVSLENDIAYVCGGRDNQFFAIDLQNVNRASQDSPQIVWSASKGIPYMTSPLLTGQWLHILSDEGIYSRYDAKTGQLHSQRRAVGAVKASMVASPKHIYITQSNGRTTVIDNQLNWQVVSENDIGETVVASPAISDGDFIIRSEQHLYLIRNHR